MFTVTINNTPTNTIVVRKISVREKKDTVVVKITNKDGKKTKAKYPAGTTFIIYHQLKIKTIKKIEDQIATVNGTDS